MPTETSTPRPKSSRPRVATDGGHDEGHKEVQPHRHDPRPLSSYAGIMASYGTLAAGLIFLLRRKRFRVHPLAPWNFVLYALAAEHISRLISKDSITSPLRKPFTQFKEPAGEGEVNEDVVGSGPRRAIGELLTCPFCLDQWVCTGLVAGSIAAPTFTNAVVSVSALARMADYLQLLYGLLREQVE